MNYYISISNGLLEGDHELRMGAAVWQFMWLLDKITKIDDEGLGWVLGGKPIKLDEIAKNRSRPTVSRNLNRLKKQGYINIKYAPFGLIISVNKAKKRFTKNDKPGLSKMINQGFKNDKPRFKNDKPNKDNTVDNNNKTTTVGITGVASDEVNEVFKIFYHQINPNIDFSKKGERIAAKWLIDHYGLERTLNAARFACSVQNQKYAPTITTPYQLKEKMASLAKFKESKQGRKIWKPSSQSLPSQQGIITK